MTFTARVSDPITTCDRLRRALGGENSLGSVRAITIVAAGSRCLAELQSWRLHERWLLLKLILFGTGIELPATAKVLQVALQPCLYIPFGLISALRADRWPLVKLPAGAYPFSRDWPGTVVVFIEMSQVRMLL